MKVKQFANTIQDQWENFESPAFPKNRKLKRITETQEGMATENVGFILNYAVSLMEPGECYFEIGTWKGRTLSYAMLGNTEKEFYACDNFSQFTQRRRWYWPLREPEPKRSLNRVLRNASPTCRVAFFEGDFRGVLSSFGKVIGVYFNDGGHTFKDQFDGLEMALLHMAPESLIVVDDTNPCEPGVNDSEAREATAQWLKLHPDWQLLFDLQAPSPPRHAGWGNGVQVLGRFRN